MIETTKTANQLYKESGSNLPFSQWIEEQKQFTFIKNDSLNTIVQNVLEEQKNIDTPINKNNNFLGLSKPVIIISLSVIVTALIYKLTISKK